MSKKTFTFFILFLLAVIAFLAWFFFFRTTPTTTPGNTQQGTDLFPFPNSTSTKPATKPTNTITDNTGDNGTIKARLPRLRQLWADPTAGAVFFPNTGTTTDVRFVDRATGHIFTSPINVLGNSEISNVTIPQIHEALFADNGNELVFRYLKNNTIIESFYAVISTSTASSTSNIEGYFLPENIRDINVSGRKILYFNPTLSTGSLIQANIDGTVKKAIMNSEARDWSLSYTNQKNAFLETRPSGEIKGFGYALNLTTGGTVKIAGDIIGLTGTINPTGDMALMSAQENNGLVSASYDLKNNITKTISVRTLSDKCAWSNVKKDVIYCAVPGDVVSGTYPDDWYKGKVSFSDALWSINLTTGEALDLMDPSIEPTSKQEMDMMKLVVDKTDSSLTFINKKDMSLWLYRLTDNY